MWFNISTVKHPEIRLSLYWHVVFFNQVFISLYACSRGSIAATAIAYILDIGCGEGYYTSAMQQQVQQCIGVDIAKTAVQRALSLTLK
jgi:protein-L-isoaspartate O-methyltransferase